MVRFAIIGVIVAVAFILYALVDAAMSDPARARGLSKPVWVVLVVVLPVIGAALWFTIGKGRGPAPAPARAPDDDPRFSGTRMSGVELDEHVRELEARLRELDEEVFPEVDAQGPGSAAGGQAKPGEARGSDSASTPRGGSPDDGAASGGSPDGSGKGKSEGDAAGEPR